MGITATNSSRASTYEEILPLIDDCKAGRLFDVQKWIDSGKPVNLPETNTPRGRKASPLEYAIKRGFHSLVEVLLKGNALIVDGRLSAVSLALECRRFDIIKLLVDFGGHNPATTDMTEVFATWDPAIMEFFIENGADVETNMPLCQALIDRIRTALNMLKKYRDRFPSFQEQANIALRRHCQEGNLKWASLLIWAGADPFSPGESEPNTKYDPDDEGLSAVGFAALWQRYEIFELKPIRSGFLNPAMHDVIRYGCTEGGLHIVKKVLEAGFDPNDQENGGCSTVQRLIERFHGAGGIRRNFWEESTKGKADTHWARENMKAIHLLLKHGAKWMPIFDDDYRDARKGLVVVKPEYTVELFWLLAKYNACRRRDLDQLLSKPTIRRHVRHKKTELAELVATVAE